MSACLIASGLDPTIPVWIMSSNCLASSPVRSKEYSQQHFLQFYSVWPATRRHDPLFGVNGTIHSGCFPLMVPINCIPRYTKENELVLERFVGSGSTLVACAASKRLGIGVDINPEAEKGKKKRFRLTEDQRLRFSHEVGHEYEHLLQNEIRRRPEGDREDAGSGHLCFHSKTTSRLFGLPLGRLGRSFVLASYLFDGVAQLRLGLLGAVPVFRFGRLKSSLMVMPWRQIECKRHI
jgi:hypothetical protein